jgi:hypothetical protein
VGAIVGEEFFPEVCAIYLSLGELSEEFVNVHILFVDPRVVCWRIAFLAH